MGKFTKNNYKGDGKMKIQRKDQILKLLAENGMMKAGDFAEKFQVSMETIRRDLTELEEAKMIRRVHGGAVLYTEYGVEPDYTYRTIANYNDKLKIASKAAEMVQDGDSIIIDIGTTTLEFAKFLRDKKNLTVFTNSLKIAMELMDEKEITVILLGGKVRLGEGTTSGFWAEQMMKEFHVDKLFLGVGAITPECGVMDYHIEESNLRRLCVKCAKQVFALADFSKFGIKALNQVCGIDEIDYVITDGKTDKKMLRELKDKGIQIFVV